MLSEVEYQRLLRSSPLLASADPQMAAEIKRATRFARVPAGRDIFLAGDEADSLALLLSGVVRVYLIGKTGREITLYRFGSGESCILTANAILNQQAFPAIATVEQPAEAVMIPAGALRDWVRRHGLWQEFVFELLSQRLLSVIAIVDQVTFGRLDARLADFLLSRSSRQNPLQITHQEIAAELGSSREVISRLLEDFASQGLLRAGRGQLEILDPAGLGDRALM